MFRFTQLVGFAVVVVFASVIWAEDSWNQWRGPNRDNVCLEKNLRENWDTPLELLWKAEGLGIGYSGVSVGNGLVCTMGDHERMEVGCLDAVTGKWLWQTEVGNPWFEGGDYSGPRCTPTIDEQYIYVSTPVGDLVCLEQKQGKIVWQKKLADYNGRIPHHGFAESPLIDGELVLCTPNAPDAAVVALNKKTGEEVWRTEVAFDGKKPDYLMESYSSIVISHGAGVKQYVQLLGVGLIGIDAATGKQLWSYSRVGSNVHQQNICTPIIYGDHVFATGAFGGGTALVKLIKTEAGVDTEEVYFVNQNDLEAHVDGRVLVGEHLYANGGIPLCMELLTGKVLWKRRGPEQGPASVLYADGNLYNHYQNGLLALISATPKKYELKGKFKVPSGGGAGASTQGWSHPAISAGKLYVREQDALYCYDLRK